MRWLAAAVLCLLLLYPRTATADRVDVQTRQLRGTGQYKLRMSAALKLAKTRDPRAVRAMVYALLNDSKSMVRRVAALSLAKMVDESVPAKERAAALGALERASKRDSDRKVRESAARTFEQLRGLRSVAKKSRVFLNIAKPADLTSKAPKGTARRMHVAVRRTLRKHAPSYSQEWPSGKLPTRRELKNNGANGYYVGATVALLQVKKKGGRAEVNCSVSVRVNPWSGRDGNEKWAANKAASATGNGKVIGSNTAAGIASAKRDCLLAVVEQVTARQVVPFLKRLER